MADESLLTDADARALLDLPQSVWWNIRISKNGGLRRAVELAELAAENGVPFTVGCMVGESGILSAAQRRLLQLVSPPRFVEGNYGKLLLTEDLTSPSLRFGWGGRIKPMKGPGLGVRVDPRSVVRYGELLRTLTGDRS
jgi:muconate cycloisomerase